MELILNEFLAGMPDPPELVRMLMRVLVATLCGALVGAQREQVGKPAGLRTHMLVCIGCALLMAAPAQAGMEAEQLSRIIQGIVTGIGFLGAGAILKREREADVTGLTTAAGIWMTAAIGVAAGLGRFDAAFLATALALCILGLVKRLERWSRAKRRRRESRGENDA